MPARPDRPIIGVVFGVLAIAALVFGAFTQQFLYSDATQLQLNDEGLSVPIGPVHEISIGFRTVTKCVTRDGQKTCESGSLSEMQTDWENQLLQARFLANEPVDDELKAAGLYDRAVKQKAVQKTMYDGDDVKALDHAQRELAAAKYVFRTNALLPLLGNLAFFGCLLGALSLLVAVGIVLAGKRVRLPVMPTTTGLLCVLISLLAGCLFVAFKPGPPGYVGVGTGFFVFGAGVVFGLYATLKLNKLMRPHDPDLLEDSMKEDEF
jgi:hypothetical protein